MEMDVNQPQLKKPVDWDEMYPGRFLKAGELLGKQVTLKIKSVDVDELEGDKGKKIKGVLTFEQTTKQIALNRTNGLCLRGMFGRQLAGWVGKRVTWYPAELNGEPCIRVWGSPDISQDMTIEVALPRRRPTQMVMHVVRLNSGGQSQRSGQTQSRAAEPPRRAAAAYTVDSDSEPPDNVDLIGSDEPGSDDEP